jgi:hypothetical protein
VLSFVLRPRCASPAIVPDTPAAGRVMAAQCGEPCPPEFASYGGVCRPRAYWSDCVYDDSVPSSAVIDVYQDRDGVGIMLECGTTGGGLRHVKANHSPVTADAEVCIDKVLSRYTKKEPSRANNTTWVYMLKLLKINRPDKANVIVGMGTNRVISAYTSGGIPPYFVGEDNDWQWCLSNRNEPA